MTERKNERSVNIRKKERKKERKKQRYKFTMRKNKNYEVELEKASLMSVVKSFPRCFVLLSFYLELV